MGEGGTEIRHFCIEKVVVCAMEGWCMLVGGSPFAVEKFLLVVAVVGGKGGMMMLTMVGTTLWARAIEIAL